MVKTKHSILNGYQNKAAQQQKQIDGLKRKLNNISFSRLGLFIAEILMVALIINFGFEWFFGVLLFVPLVLFLVLVKKQTTVQKELAYTRALLWVYQNEINQLSDGKNGYDNGNAYADEYHPYASDLDIFGQGSLYSYVNRCNTNDGLDLLAANLSRANDKATILQRQEAIAELINHIAQTFHFRAELQDHKPEQLRVIKNKLQHELPGQLKFARNRTLRLYVKLVPFVTMGMLALAIGYGGLLWQFFALVLLFNSGLTFFNLAAINRVYNGFGKGSAMLNAFAGTVKWTEDVKWNSTYIKGFFDSSKSDQPVSAQIRSLSAIIQAFDARLNIIVSAFLNLFLLWDLKCSINLSNWHDKSSIQLIKGMLRISQFEELISFATLSYNQPDWNFPLIEDNFHFSASKLGHPLIPEKVRVLNDFNVTANPTVDIVTGSNMAGKSTFLRTAGINMVLAFTGAAVCAAQMSVSIFNILSYMRIKDSLNDQTSTFKAELNRLKMILDAIQTNQNSFVLIDEMLRGTNSKDKYLGSKVFIEKMIEQKTPALFATHDLQLSEMEEDHPEKIRNYHFDIQISEGEMNFDYKLKHGPCKTFNAALLLKQIGLTLT
ncbi:MutS-related protein [Pedobacter heparinus]|uniref:DNA mismatch repair protein MutS domain protein n=1 Tax=Pedobacter heparinus (strain ATCC 13125 / DSM 2366 / CIP 104194 / JCM 7457 / NBRC 12017 / NCIMB 9290 / NRRL B-14731 / HIM 762-3) TaxID=485917 RepID=C6Y1A2_PEDHD|nr:DNA mismatch repair protein MutS [Pedobacter heparinus]ACU02878.1 DNA mismatch repair protein MutS domain protein [Pedobacter heparinus DSM 2366]